MGRRVSRGFHRLGLFLAALIVLIGASYWLIQAVEVTGYSWRHNEALTIFCKMTRSDFGI
jgi:hypothetical protein